ncbi:hypothetical protein [Ectobacillus sp. sgz5001026]|uniref:hypothetical protein n=1 Tax=Ectobacillus sp. sgz5001026 TaxID=3242473 RepID=UPI0036D3D902
MYVILLILLLICYQLYERYVPVYGVNKITNEDCKETIRNVVCLDVRDYQDAYKDPIEGSKNLPYGYLKRYLDEIENRDIVIIASDAILKNISIRLLRRHGFRIQGYYIYK